MISSEDFALENLEVLSVNVVLMLPPSWSPFLVLQTPVDCEQRRENLKLITGNKHLVDLSVPRVSVSKESLIMRRVVIRCDEEWLVKKLMEKSLMQVADELI